MASFIKTSALVKALIEHGTIVFVEIREEGEMIILESLSFRNGVTIYFHEAPGIVIGLPGDSLPGEGNFWEPKPGLLGKEDST